MKVLLLGATGRTGKFVLKKALEKGWEVNCLARKVERIKAQKGLHVFEGNPNEKADLEKAIFACNGIINVLNISRKSDFPWAKLRTPERYLSEVANKLIAVAEQNKVKRITICSAWGVLETEKDIPNWFKWLIHNSNIGAAYRDHERQEEIISQSQLDWTIVRPVGLTNSRKEQKIRETFDNQPKPSLMLSRSSLASYLVDSLERKDLSGKRVVVSKD